MAVIQRRKIVFLVFLIPLTIFVLYVSKGAITPFVFSFFLAYAVNPLVDFFQKKGARRDLAILTVYLILFLLTALVVGLVIPRLIQDLLKLTQKLPELFQTFRKIEGTFNQICYTWQLPFNLKSFLEGLVNRGEFLSRNFLIHLGQGMINLFSQSLLLLALVPILAFYISRDYPGIKKRTYDWVSKNFGQHWTNTIMKIDSVFRVYIQGQLLVNLIVGTLIGLGLGVMGFEAAILLGLVAGLFNVIPYFGPVLGIIPSIVLALFQSPWLVLYVILLFLAVNQLEVMLLTPRIIGCSLGLHPVTVIFLILIGGKVFGLLGMIFAVPLGAISLVILQSIYEICFNFGLKDSTT